VVHPDWFVAQQRLTSGTRLACKGQRSTVDWARARLGRPNIGPVWAKLARTHVRRGARHVAWLGSYRARVHGASSRWTQARGCIDRRLGLRWTASISPSSSLRLTVHQVHRAALARQLHLLFVSWWQSSPAASSRVLVLWWLGEAALGFFGIAGP
jgi:hypothetical protein